MTTMPEDNSMSVPMLRVSTAVVNLLKAIAEPCARTILYNSKNPTFNNSSSSGNRTSVSTLKGSCVPLKSLAI